MTSHRAPTSARKRATVLPTQRADQTFRDHLLELRGRVFWVVVAFLLASAAAYPSFERINALLVAPLGDQQLYYLTPAGGLSFIIKVCMITGALMALPVAAYQMYRYLQPLLADVRRRQIVGYTLSSAFLALAGMTFAYYVSLPAALHFLTGFDLAGISALLTIDSYLSFVAAYVLGSALLFQLPLIMLLINGVTPLPPGGMLRAERPVLAGAFVAGAVISPTPDILNQTILALPIVLMYQLGIVLVLLTNARRRRRAPQRPSVPLTTREQLPARSATDASAAVLRTPQPSQVLMSAPSRPPLGVDMVRQQRGVRSVPRRPSSPGTIPRAPARPMPARRPQAPGGLSRSLDGFPLNA